MIKQLRRKLIAACMISLTIVLTVILGGVNPLSDEGIHRNAAGTVRKAHHFLCAECDGFIRADRL